MVTRPDISLAQDRESSPARTGGLTTMLHHQLVMVVVIVVVVVVMIVVVVINEIFRCDCRFIGCFTYLFDCSGSSNKPLESGDLGDVVAESGCADVSAD